MSNAEPVDQRRAHRVFSADCFNRTWELLDRTDRSAADDEQMAHLAHASLWHWTQREDGTAQNLSVGYWLLARVYAAAGQGENATRYANRCLELSQGLPPFYLGYAHEAAARAAQLSGDAATMETHLAAARTLVAQVTDEQERGMLAKDLAGL